MNALKRTIALFAIVLGALYIFTVLYDLFQHRVFDPFALAIAALVLYAVFDLDRKYVRPMLSPPPLPTERESTEEETASEKRLAEQERSDH